MIKTRFVTNFFVFFRNRPSWRMPACFIFIFWIFSGCSMSRKNHRPDKTPSLDVKIGQMLMVGFRGLQIDSTDTIAKAIRQHNVGGVFLFDYDVPTHNANRNIESPSQLKKLTQQLQSYADKPLLIGIDQEGGRVSRLKEKFGFPGSVSEQYLGTLNEPDSTRKYARRTAIELKNEGINLNLAPVVDLNLNSDNPIIGGLERSFSADPGFVTHQAEIYIKTLHQKGILTTLKHFPGHGSSRKDSHKGVVDVTHTWQKKELIPYRRLIQSGSVDLIMTAHIFNARLDSTYPATLSRPVITGLLRDSLNFHGVVISDDLQMGAIRKEYGLRETIRRSIGAGVDMLSFGNNTVFEPQIAFKAHHIINEMVKNGAISEERIDRSYQRIMKLKKRLH